MNAHASAFGMADPTLVEPVAAPTLYPDALGPVVIHGGNLHLLLAQWNLGVDGRMERYLAARVVWRLDHARCVVRELQKALNGLGLN